jgi:hypothetical protein
VVRKVNVDDLVGAAEIAERLGYAHVESVHKLRSRHDDFPVPLKQLSQALVWDWNDVAAWAKSHNKLQ